MSVHSTQNPAEIPPIAVVEGDSILDCWGPEKLRRLLKDGVLPQGAVPLCPYATKVFWVRDRRFHEKLP